MQPRVRQAELRDIEKLGSLKLRASLAWGDHVQELQSLPGASTFPLEHLQFAFVAEIGHEVVGFAAVVGGPEGRAELEDLFVVPGNWRRGIGLLLLIEAENRACAMGAHSLHVAANKRACGFYAGRGSEWSG